VLVALGALLLAAPAGAANRASGLYVVGAGNGHGVGMSQYGAAGYALHGASYQQILRDYYAGTTLGHVDPSRTVTVLLRVSGSAVFSGATTIKGATTLKGAKLKLNPLWNYSVVPAGSRLRVMLGRRLIGSFNAPLQVGGTTPVKLNGLGTYRGLLVFRRAANGNGVMTTNEVGLDDYVQGVVTSEMPSSWPAQALEAQAVAARTYAITQRPVTASYDVYDNTRSQMYGGVKAETAAGDAAVAATSGEVVEYAGAPVETYFFSSSGGETESVQNVFQIAPESWLVGRPDPYDGSLDNPYHRWKLTLSLKAAKAKLGGLVEGSLKGIKVLQHGVSPRIVKAQVVGTRGSVTVTGAQLRKAFGTPSTWMSFTTVSSSGVQTSTTPATTVPTTTSTGTTTSPPTGGGGLTGAIARAAAALDRAVSSLQTITSRRLAALRFRYAVTGSVFPVSHNAHVTVQVDPGGGWSSVATGTVAADGRYSVPVPERGSYRVIYGAVAGPEITVG
jgi:SpoIID/LytB domain protein